MHVDPYTTRLTRGNAYWMARIAQSVFIKTPSHAPDEAGILKDLKDDDPDFIKVTGADKNSAQAVLIEHRDYWCFAFRGSDEMRDWLDNVNAFPTRILFGEFHRGFARSTDDVWEPLFERYLVGRQADRAAGRPRPIFLVGHSLGGAMATVAAAKLLHVDLPFTSVYTFGQPRAMTLETARIFNNEARDRFFRFQNNGDIVTRVPSRLMGYSHVGICLYIAQDKRIHDDIGLWFRFLDTVGGAVEAASAIRLDAVEDHAMIDYLDAIRAWNREPG
ncbi:lipase family protein [Thiocapsa sp.]|uniref:lipase family protein n=1 Tax=Thiocapsa sp. TaxID=2024551 RepID=UPI0025F69BC4|nr:lipase family protein [Thiocapsa sp.]